MPSYSGVWNLVQQLQATAAGLWPVVLSGDIGIFAGGGSTNVIQYVYITTTGNTTDFGDLTEPMNGCGGAGSSTRGVIASSYVSGTLYSNTINYLSFSSTGDASDFGDLTVARQIAGAFSNSTRACWAGGDASGGDVNVIDYITIATTGNATDFGDQVSTGAYMSGLASTTRGVWAGAFEGLPSGQFNTINYVTIATTGNALDFGDLSVPHGQFRLGAASSSTRGLFAGGRDNSIAATSNVIDYITIASTGNATDFGDLTVARYGLAGTSSSTRAIFGGGANVIDYVTIASTGNATDFGDLLSNISYLAATSNVHGGL